MKIFSSIIAVLVIAVCVTGRKHKTYRQSAYQYITDIANRQQRCRIRPPEPCNVKILSDEHSKHCIEERKAEVERSRLWYQVTDETKVSIIKFPLKTVPFLNQTIADLSLHYAFDKDEGRYTILATTWINLMNNAIVPKLIAAFGTTPLKTFQQHKQIYNIQSKTVQGIPYPESIGNPTMESTFTDHINQPGDIWRTDEAFVQRRLASICPFLLRKVTKSGDIGINAYKLAGLLNKDVLDGDFEMDLGDDKKITLKNAIEEERLFVLYNEEMDGRKAVPDITDLNTTDNRIVRELSSPISLYVLKNDGMLSVVAIQWDSNRDSKVYLPSGIKLKWEIAKAQVEFIADTYCKAGPHLGGSHFIPTVFCLVYRRHFSRQHPLYDLFKFHCEGTIPHISTAYTTVVAENSNIHRYSSLGHIGYRDIALNEFNKRFYGHFDLRTLIKKRGLDDKRLKYYPFRDDALLILPELKKFTSEMVDMYYKDDFKGGWYNRHHRKRPSFNKHADVYDMFYETEDEKNEKDNSILRDEELQSYVNEISADGEVPPDGGKGKFTDFPAKFVNKRQLKQFILRFLWYNIIHTSVNYPLAPEFMPINPSKVYTRTDGEIETLEEMFTGYGEPADAIINNGDRSIIANFRANRLFGYFENVRDRKFGKLVRKAYFRMQDCVQKTLAKRNAERKAKSLLGFQYFEPRYITNSIHI